MANKPLKSLTFPGLSDTYTIPEKTSDLTNDSGFVNSAGAASAAPIQGVNGQTGNVVLNAGNIGFDDSTTYPSGSVGAEVDALKSQTDNLDNLYNIGTIEWPTGGYIKNDGTVQGYTNFFSTDFIPVTGKVHLIATFTALNNFYHVSCYDKEKITLAASSREQGKTRI